MKRITAFFLVFGLVMASALTGWAVTKAATKEPRIYPYDISQCRLSTPIDVGIWRACPGDGLDQTPEELADAITATTLPGDLLGDRTMNMTNKDRYPAGVYTWTQRVFTVDKPNKRVVFIGETSDQWSWELTDDPTQVDENAVVVTPPEHVYVARTER